MKEELERRGRHESEWGEETRRGEIVRVMRWDEDGKGAKVKAC